MTARTVPVKELARLSGYSVRAVHNWLEEGGNDPIPHDPIVLAGGKKSATFNVDEVVAWLVRHGKELKGELADRAVKPTTTTVKELPEGGTLAEQVRALSRALLQSANTTNLTPTEAQKLAGAIKHIVSELRQLEEQQFEDEKRRGEWIRKTEAIASVVELAQAFVADVDGLAADLPRAAVGSLEGVIPTDRIEEARRLVAAACKSVVERARKRRVSELAKIAGTP